MDLKYLPPMPDESQRQYLFTAIDRATRWVYVEILPNKSVATAEDFLKRLIDKAPFTITKVLTDNGKEFIDGFCTTGEREPTGHHPFDRVCEKHPQTNGMIERFKGRLAEVVDTTRFNSSKTLSETITGYVSLYNHHIPQKALGHIAPIDTMNKWAKSHPALFKKRVSKQMGLDR